MAQVIKEIQVEVSKPNFFQAIIAKQFDYGSRYLRVTLVDEDEKITVADTSSVTINAKRSDGGEKKFVGEVDIGKGTVLVPLTYWMLELEGKVISDVSIIDTSGNILTTTSFIIEVERASCQDSDVSEDDVNFDVLTGLILQVQDVKNNYDVKHTYDPNSTEAISGKGVALALKNIGVVGGGSTGDGGVSVTHSWNGTVLTITSASGTSSANLKGEKGADGKTPDKGTDYFTEADKQEMVEDVIASIDGIPDYWFDTAQPNNLIQGANAIRQAMETAGRNKSSFLFYSDAHWGYNSGMSPKLLKYLSKHTAINKTIFGGDFCNTYTDGESKTMDEWMEVMREYKLAVRDIPNHHSVVGNHDKDITAISNDKSLYSFLFAPEESNDIVRGGDFFYYIDDKNEKTRYFYLDTGLKIDLEKQFSFLINELKTTPSGWHIIVVSHIWFSYYDSSKPDVGSVSEDNQKITALLNAYNNGESGNVTINTTTLSYDFSTNKGDNKSKVEFCIGGHTHIDFSIVSNEIPIILCRTDSRHLRDASSFPYKAGTTSESAVSGIIADYDNKVITVVRVGRGSGCTFSLETGVTHTHDYTSEITTAATCTATGVRTYTCSCGDTYTETIPAIGHTYVDGVCSVCGAEDSDEPVENNTIKLVNVVDADGNTVESVSYQKDVRWSTSSNSETSTNASGIYLSDYIPVFDGDIFKLENITMPDEASNFCQLHFFTSVGVHTGNSGNTNLTNYNDAVWSNGNLTQFTVESGYNFIRIQCAGFNENSVITKIQQ